MRCPARLEIQSFIDEELPQVRAVEVAHHLEGCHDCRQLAADLAAVRSLLGSFALVEAPARSAASAPPPSRRPARRWRWTLLPAAACLIVGLMAAWRSQIGLFGPAKDERAFVAAFVEAHSRVSAAEALPGPCDFGL